MNILIITAVSGFLPGFETRNVEILKGMGYEVHYASNFHNPVYKFDMGELERLGVRCHHVPISKSPLSPDNFRALREIREIIKSFDIKCVHCHNPMGGVTGRLAGIGTKEKPYCIYTAHGFHFYRGGQVKSWLFFYPAERFLARFTDRLICINREDEEIARGFHLRKGGRVIRIPGTGVDTCRFSPDSQARAETRKELGLGEGDFLFLSAGELNENKNHETAIKALACTDRKEAVYIICGEGKKRRDLERLTESLGLSGRVKLPGYERKMEKYYRAADCFLFPSVREGLGMAALEAMACGLPLIAADNRGSREFAGKGVILCDPADTGQWASAMREVIQKESLRGIMGREARKRAEDFSREKSEKIMRLVYEEMDRAVRGRQIKEGTG
ncbi:MAG TPA: glycosyltransferase family 4 protein [Candidatus Copromorpha excrementigallinarum]|uniref:Glycosyltransferase family 4 protein n=1 Tax=Candidatus Allocopromorpha excrementigallinarum TaxID=2840742 RepID=A0A9D1L6V0_9FIRM|nr:glycosyltransferase family 4 protein [Candidatus Copromorpha excrementigallinarum]